MAMFRNEEDRRRELATSDVFLYPGYWEGGSRRETDTTPMDFTGSSQPIVAANMNAVSGSRMAESMARHGGIAILPQDIPADKLVKMVGKIKSAFQWCDTAITVDPDTDAGVAMSLVYKRAANIVVVVDNTNTPIGVLRPRDMADADKFTPIRRLMSTNLVTVTYDMPIDQAYALLHNSRVDAAPVVGSGGILMGTVSQHDLVAKAIVKPSLDSEGRLMVGLAIGINGDPVSKARAALALGVDVLVLDTAHGHQKKMVDVVTAVRRVVDASSASVALVAGNVCTGKGAEALFDAGSHIVKVGVGPGGACTTRMMTGVGRPQLSAVMECAEVAKIHGGYIWADGGVRHPRDLCHYMAAGASRVMLGTILAGTHESPGDLKFDNDGRAYKHHWGMASNRAVRERNGGVSAYEQAVRRVFEEGVSDSTVYLKPGMESVGGLVTTFVAGLKSSMTYVGAKDLAEYTANAVFGVQTGAGFTEGTPHGLVSK